MTDTLLVDRDLLKSIEQILAMDCDSLDCCDHDVNICYCSEREVLVELRLVLQGKRTCPNCFGEGIDLFGDMTDERSAPCFNCSGVGTVPIGNGPQGACW